MNTKFQKFLDENYSNLDLSNWERWMSKYVEPAFDKSRHQEMIRNFGYTSMSSHDFNAQYEIYDQLKSESEFDEETKKFIGFLAGAGFFKQWNLTLKDWFNMSNWVHPYWQTPNRKSIRELLRFDKGLLCIKLELLEMPFWKR